MTGPFEEIPQRFLRGCRWPKCYHKGEICQAYFTWNSLTSRKFAKCGQKNAVKWKLNNAPRSCRWSWRETNLCPSGKGSNRNRVASATKNGRTSRLSKRGCRKWNKGVLHASPLEEVASTAGDRRGIVRLHRMVDKVPAPKNSEEVRRCIRLEAATFEVVKMRNPKKADGRYLGAACEVILGEKVANFRFPTQVGEKGSSWGTILAYELKVRKEVVSMPLRRSWTLPWRRVSQLCRGHPWTHTWSRRWCDKWWGEWPIEVWRARAEGPGKGKSMMAGGYVTGLISSWFGFHQAPRTSSSSTQLGLTGSVAYWCSRPSSLMLRLIHNVLSRRSALGFSPRRWFCLFCEREIGLETSCFDGFAFEVREVPLEVEEVSWRVQVWLDGIPHWSHSEGGWHQRRQVLLGIQVVWRYSGSGDDLGAQFPRGN